MNQSQLFSIVGIRPPEAPPSPGPKRRSRDIPVLFHGLRVRMPVEDTSAAGRTKTPAGELSGRDAALFTALKSVRSKLARREGVPAYVIFSNATLTDMARRRPRSRADFLDVSGVGERKAQRYAKAFLEAIEAFESEEFS